MDHQIFYDHAYRGLTRPSVGASGAPLSPLVALLHDGYLVTDLQGLIIAANPAAAQLLDLPSTRPSGHSLAALLAEDDRRQFEATLLTIERLVQPPSWIVHLPRVGGADVALVLTATLARTSAGLPWQIHWLVQPASPAAEQPETDGAWPRLLQLTLEHSSDPLLIAVPSASADDPLRIVYANPAFGRLLGQREDAALGPARQLLPGALIEPDTIAVVERALEQVQPATVEFGTRRSDGTELWIELRLQPVLPDLAEPPLWLALYRDITERRWLEAQLRQAHKLESLGRLTINIAHDFNNLLTAILGYADLAAATSDGSARSDMVEIRHIAEHGAALTSRLLAFARQQAIAAGAVNLNDLVRSMERLLERLLGPTIELRLDLDRSLSAVNAEIGQIEQVVLNLALNACDAMAEQGALTIATSSVTLAAARPVGATQLPAGSYVRLSVSDTGVGIADAIAQHIFEPFFTTKEAGRGTGLGLATCAAIVKEHGGAIECCSVPGRGTTFDIYLPQIAAQTTPEIIASELALPGGAETVLLVEDDPLVRSVVARILRGHGYTVLVAASGAEALRLAQTHAPLPIHLLLTDVVLPELNGIALAELLRAELPDLQVLFTSGFPAPALAEHGALAPGQLLDKPFSALALAQAVRAALDRPRQPPADEPRSILTERGGQL